MAYQVFKRTGIRVDSPVLSIAPNGQITLNAAATRVVEAAGVKYVIVLWDPVNHRMGLKATAKGDSNGYAVSLASNKHSGSLRAKTFMRHIGWKATQRETLPAAWIEKGKMFEVVLPDRCLPRERGTDAKRK